MSRSNETSGFLGSLGEAIPKLGGDSIRDAKIKSVTLSHTHSNSSVPPVASREAIPQTVDENYRSTQKLLTFNAMKFPSRLAQTGEPKQ